MLSIGSYIFMCTQDFRGRPPITAPLLKDEGLISDSTATAQLTKAYPNA